MYKRFTLYAIFSYSIIKYYEFFIWYLGQNQMIIEEALFLALSCSISMFLFIIGTHILYFPKIRSHAKVLSYPPLIFLFSMNLGFLISTINMYSLQIYKIPTFFDILRSYQFGILLILIALLIFYLSIKEFSLIKEDPIPTSSTSFIIKKSIYGYTRNPMYLAMIILQIGVGMALSMMHIVFFSIFTFIILKYFVVFPEEFYLEKKFGREYINYRNKVRRWI